MEELSELEEAVDHSGVVVGSAEEVLAASVAREEQRAASVVPAHEVITIVRSAGLSPVSKPTRRGTNYLLRALDTEEQPVEEGGAPLGSRFARPAEAFDHRQRSFWEATG